MAKRITDKRALVPTTNMLGQANGMGYGDDLTPIQKVKPNPNFDPAAYDPDIKETWPNDPDSGKGAFLGGWQTYVLTGEERARYDQKGNGVGIVCRRAPADGKAVSWFDCDIKDRTGSALVLDHLRDELPALGHIRFFIRRRGGDPWLVPVRIGDGVPAYEQRHTKEGHSLERGGAGHQFVALGPHASGGWRYWSQFDLIDGHWVETPLDAMPARDELPELTLTQFYKLFDAMAAACGAAKRKGGSGGALPPSGDRQRLLPAEDFDHHAIPKGKEAVFLAVLAELSNTKNREQWIGCNSVLVGSMRQWSREDAWTAVSGFDDKYDGPQDAEEDEDVFNEKWTERGRLREGWPEFVQWAKAELGYSRLRALGVTHEDMMLHDEATGERIIRLSRADLAENIAEIVGALRAKGVALLSYGGRVMHPSFDAGEHLTALGRDDIRMLLLQKLTFERYDANAKDWLRCAVPKEVAELMLSAPARALLPQVRGLLEWPSLRPDGSLLDQPGHDEATGYYLSGTVAELAAQGPATRKEAESALALLSGLLAEFPFANPESKSASIAAMLHLAARPLMDVVPMVVASSPSPRTGKSLLCRVIAAVATGRVVSNVMSSNRPDEFEKRIESRLLTGSPIVILDNCEGRLSSPALAQGVENPLISLRKMGGHTDVSVPNTFAFLANGNNVRVSGDLPARCLFVELDAKVANPEHRQFKREPLSEVLADPGVYLSAALAIVRWGMQANLPTPAGMTPLASFGKWSKLIREPLVHLGLPDPCLTQEHLRDESDDMGAADAAAFAVLADMTKGKPHTVQALIAASMALTPDQRGMLLDVAEDERNRGNIGRYRLGCWLRKHKRRQLGIVTLTKHDLSHKGHPPQWIFTRPASAPQNAPAPLPPLADAPDDMV